MDDDDKVVKHLELIQNVVSRLANNSSFIKNLSMSLLIAALIFTVRNDQIPIYVVLLYALPVLGFWGLDGYFLWKERAFRGLYDDVREKTSTDFEMDIKAQRGKTGVSWLSATFSGTLIPFYTIQLLVIAFLFIVLCTQVSK